MLSVHRKHDLIYSDVACLASIPKKKTRSYSQGVIGKVNDLKFLTIPRRLPMVRCCLCKAAVLPLVSIRKVTPHSIFYKNIAELSKLSVFGTLNGDVFVGVLSELILP